MTDPKMTLAPCPFCGGAAVEATKRDEHRPDDSVGCGTPGCAGAANWYRRDAWNRRASPTKEEMEFTKAAEAVSNHRESERPDSSREPDPWWVKKENLEDEQDVAYRRLVSSRTEPEK